MGKHALLAASSSHRWLICTPSVRLETYFKKEVSAFAAEGTAAHNLSEHKIKQFLGQNSTKPESDYDCDELEHYTDMYAEFAAELINEARAKCKDPIIMLEQRLDYSNYAEGGFGTGDIIIVYDGMLDIADLKYGRGVLVSAENNPQMKLYALGALNLFDDLYDVKKIRMTIFQPRLDNVSVFEMTKDELINWAENELKPKAELAFKGEGKFVPGEHCRFCRARNTCRARADELLKLAQFEFKEPDLLSDDEIEEILSTANELSSWAEDVYSYAANKAISEGKKWHGFKLVEGRSIRKYLNEDKVVEALNTAGYKDIYKKSLIGITAMERLLGKKQFNKLLDRLVIKPKGKLSLVPDSDKRDEIKNIVEEEFLNE